MKKETVRIHRVIRDLLDFARPDAPPPEDGGVRVASVRAVLGDVVSLVSPQPAFRSVPVELDLHGADLQAAIDPDRLMQVALNLTLNAADAVAGAPDGRIVWTASEDEDSVVLAIEDSGPGVDIQLGDRVFDPFVTTKDVGKGTGLGLAVCRGIVEAASGSIRLDKSYEGGARFVITLPRGRVSPPGVPL